MFSPHHVTKLIIVTNIQLAKYSLLAATCVTKTSMKYSFVRKNVSIVQRVYGK